MNLSTTLPDVVTDTIRHAAETTRHAAASTAHTLSTLADDAQHRLDDLEVPGRHRPVRSRRRLVLLAALVAVLAAAAVWRRRGTDRSDTHTRDDRTAPEAVGDTEPVMGSLDAPLASVR